MQVERRRAERTRAAQLNMLSAEDRQMQLAKELNTAMDSAKQVRPCFLFPPEVHASFFRRSVCAPLALKGFLSPACNI